MNKEALSYRFLLWDLDKSGEQLVNVKEMTYG